MHIIYLHKNIISIKYGLARENIRANTSGKCRREDSSKPDHMIVSDTQTKTRVNTHTNIYIHIYTQIFGHFKNTKRGNQPGEHTHTLMLGHIHSFHLVSLQVPHQGASCV